MYYMPFSFLSQAGPRSMGKFARQGLAGLVFLTGLAACTVQQPQPATPVEEPVVEPPAEDQSTVTSLLDEEERHRRMVSDILYSGMRALRADRLLTPPEDSAYRYFSRALALDPGNNVALEGMQDIVRRYLQLAELSSRQGQFDNAETYLRRAAQVDPDYEGIVAAHNNLAAERERTHSVHTLDGRALYARNESMVDQLQQLARTVYETQAFVLITAPNDELGRWIYAQMQAALIDYRVRGDIEIGDQATVRLVRTGNS
ncbi:MAG TPA: hypothetical protein DEG76_07390 [Pseudohongiella sp.]|nr:hypothetical protein [Pseudohongiella sp.]HBX37103.1 hypothetical protein [Pseudohongiella sp.]|tara:strand:+ start:7120 stop:7896 length:777 start_codon:yes stop_codon:yes gene_type:complete